MHFGDLAYWLSEDADDRLIATACELLEQMNQETQEEVEP